MQILSFLSTLLLTTGSSGTSACGDCSRITCPPPAKIISEPEIARKLGDDPSVIPDCSGRDFVPFAWLGDGECHRDLNCASYDFDAGDCSDDGSESELILDCPARDPYPSSRLGDGTCDSFFNCERYNFDEGDCVNFVVDCFGNESPQAWLGDRFCDLNFACVEFQWDSLDCSPNVQDCRGRVYPSNYIGDTKCDNGFGVREGIIYADFNCSAFGYDEGDCLEGGEGSDARKVRYLRSEGEGEVKKDEVMGECFVECCAE